MTDQPRFELPPGFRLEATQDGYRVVPAGERNTKTVAFRTTPTEYMRLMSFVDTFPTRQWGDAFRWLLSQPAVAGVMDGRVAEATVRLTPGD